MSDIQKICRASVAVVATIAAGLATAFGARVREASAAPHAAANTGPGAIVRSQRIDKAALAAMYLQARFPVLALQYIAVLRAGAKISGPLRDELAALSHLADTFGFTFSAGTVLLIGKDANGGIVGPAA